MNSETPLKNVVPLEGYPSEIGMVLWMLEDARKRTLMSLENISQDVIDWPPPHERNSIGTLLYHIPAIEASWLYEDVLKIDFPPIVADLFPHPVRDPAGTLWVVEDVSIDDHLHRLDTIRRELLTQFKNISAEDFHAPRESDNVIITPCWVLHHLIQHETEHRGHIQELRKGAEAKLKIRSLTNYTEPPEAPSSRRAI